MRQNTIFQESGRTTGYFAMSSTTTQLERLAALEYDYIVLDAQHGTFDDHTQGDAVRAVERGGVPAFIRVAEPTAGAVGRALDTGAAGIIAPLVDTADEAARIVSAAKYPPLGVRSRGTLRRSDYLVGSLEEVNAKTAVLCMIETAEGLENVESIAAVDGVDGLYIGPNDLTIGLGGSGIGDPSVEGYFIEAVAAIREAAEAAGKFVVFHTASGKIAQERRKLGFRHVTIANDVNHVCEAAASHLAVANGE